MLKKDGIYFAYLRKSREDRDAEQNGAEDTLARHEYILRGFAERGNIQISRWYKEVVSGETISDRPEMIRLLADVEAVRPDGVLVAEVERLSRGNPQDQGRVMDTFKYSGTLIITPTKTYDLTQENDEEWMDFGLLRSRMEYRTIKRRLQNGRSTSAMQGKFVGNKPPYGWLREKLKGEKGYTLVPDPDTGWVLALMYRLISSGNEDTGFLPVGTTTVAHILDRMGIPSPGGKKWDAGTVARVVKNPANIGMVRIGWRKEVTVVTDGKRRKSRPVNHDCILVPARWKGQISQEAYDTVIIRLKRNSRTGTFCSITTPLAGVIRCGICGRAMVRRPRCRHQKYDILLCPSHGCPTVGSYYDLVEQRLLGALEDYLHGYRLSLDGSGAIDWMSCAGIKQANLRELQNTLEKLECRLSKVCTLFEQEIYDLPTYRLRSEDLKAEISDVRKRLENTRSEILWLQGASRADGAAPCCLEPILASYWNSENPAYKNALIKELVSGVVYTKAEKGKKNGDGMDAFELDVHINLLPPPASPGI